MSTSVHLRIVDSIHAVLSFDQPDSKVNTLSSSVWYELGVKLEQIRSQPLEGLIITSSKPGIFLAGADLNEFLAVDSHHLTSTRNYLQLGHRVLELLESLPFPTIAAIDGICLGGGFEVALGCDFRIVGTHPKLKIGLPEVSLGLVPGWGGTQRLPRLRGFFAALRYICAGEMFTPEQAVAEQLALEMVASDELIPTAHEILELAWMGNSWKSVRSEKQQLASTSDEFNDHAPTESLIRDSLLSYCETLIGPAKQASLEAIELILLASKLPLAEGLQRETEAFLRLIVTEECRSAIQAFFDARKKP